MSKDWIPPQIPPIIDNIWRIHRWALMREKRILVTRHWNKCGRTQVAVIFTIRKCMYHEALFSSCFVSFRDLQEVWPPCPNTWLVHWFDALFIKDKCDCQYLLPAQVDWYESWLSQLCLLCCLSSGVLKQLRTCTETHRVLSLLFKQRYRAVGTCLIKPALMVVVFSLPAVPALQMLRIITSAATWQFYWCARFIMFENWTCKMFHLVAF